VTSGTSYENASPRPACQHGRRYVNLDQDDDDLPVVTGTDETEFGIIHASLNYKLTTY
jgi:hypothetical protein